MSEQKTHAEIIARMRSDAEEDEYTPDEILWQTLRSLADSLEEAQRREIDVLKRRINELDAEIAAKDEVIKRLNDAIAEDQRRKMAAAENSSAVGDTAKLREALKATLDLFFDIHNANRSPQSNQAYAVIHKIKAALAAPPRNCDKYPTFNDAIRALADKRGWHDAKWDSERYCILASWLLAPATEKEGGNDGRK